VKPEICLSATPRRDQQRHGNSIQQRLKASNVTAWAGTSTASEGPGNVSAKISEACKAATGVSPLQGFKNFLQTLTLGLRAGRFTPGFHITGFQP
jgi:hypothetical protein